MRLFYPTPTTFPERKRKLRQCPEKLRTIGKCLFFSFPTPSNHSSLCACVRKTQQGSAACFRSRTPARKRAHTFCCLGLGFCFGLSNKHCHAYTVKSAARALDTVLTHPRSRTHPSRTRTTSSLVGTRLVNVFHAGTCAVRACLTERNSHPHVRTQACTRILTPLLIPYLLVLVKFHSTHFLSESSLIKSANILLP